MKEFNVNNKIELSVKPPIKIRGFSDLVYKNMLDDYEYHFCGEVVTVETNYKLLDSFNVYFEPKQLPHLLGWDKITNKKIGAGRIIELVTADKFNIDTTRKHHNFNDSRKRMLNYNFLHEVFIYHNHKVCIMTKDMKPNTMRLDMVFYKEGQKEATILGLRKMRNMDYFVPTTLHNRGLNNQFSRRRRSAIKSIQWHQESEASLIK